MYNVPVQKMINTIRKALILEYGPGFLRLSEKDQNLLIIKAFNDLRTEE